MSQIPIYLKTDPDMARPTDPEYYLITGSGTFFGRNHPFWQSDAPVKRFPRSLAAHQPYCKVDFPKLGVAALEYIVGFFDKVYQLHGSESIILLYWDTVRQRYKLVAPQQEATVWESSSGTRSAQDVAYKLPVPPPRDHLLVADIHCHCDFGAYASYTDEKDEQYRDGVHAIVGRVHREPPEFHLEMAVDGYRFSMRPEQLFAGYRRRRKFVPKQWMDQLTVKVNRPKPYYYHTSDTYNYGPSGGYGSQGGRDKKDYWK